MLFYKFPTIKVIPLVFLSILIAACTNEDRVKGGLYYSHNDFKRTETLKGSLINVPLRGKPMEYLVLRDSILLINYWEVEDGLIDVVNIHTGKLLVKIGKKGSESGALLSASLKYKSPLDNYFIIRDFTKNLLVRFDIDSLLTNEKYAGKAFSIPSFAGDATFYNDDSIVFFNSFWLKIGDSLMNSNSKEPLLFMSLNTSSLENDVADLEKRKRPKFFTPNVTGGNILIDPENKNIWLVDNYFDKITVYDNKLDVQKYLLGPENAKVKYELRTDSAIYFRNGKYYKSFYPSIYSESYVYLLYIGIKGINLDHTRIERPVTLLKFDWKGAPVEEYKLDEYLYNISLSGDGKVLYGTTAKRFGDTARLIKYNL